MRPPALVSEDDPAIREALGDSLDSLGHDHHCVGCLDEARERLGNCSHTRILLDLELPARFGRPPSIPAGMHPSHLAAWTGCREADGSGNPLFIVKNASRSILHAPSHGHPPGCLSIRPALPLPGQARFSGLGRGRIKQLQRRVGNPFEHGILERFERCQFLPENVRPVRFRPCVETQGQPVLVL